MASTATLLTGPHPCVSASLAWNKLPCPPIEQPLATGADERNDAPELVVNMVRIRLPRCCRQHFGL